MSVSLPLVHWRASQELERRGRRRCHSRPTAAPAAAGEGEEGSGGRGGRCGGRPTGAGAGAGAAAELLWLVLLLEMVVVVVRRIISVPVPSLSSSSRSWRQVSPPTPAAAAAEAAAAVVRCFQRKARSAVTRSAATIVISRTISVTWIPVMLSPSSPAAHAVTGDLASAAVSQTRVAGRQTDRRQGADDERGNERRKVS